MRVRRARAGGGAALLVAVLASWAPPHTAAAATEPSLGQVTRVTTSRSVATTVRVDTPAHFGIGGGPKRPGGPGGAPSGPSSSVTGEGRFQGLVLEQRGFVVAAVLSVRAPADPSCHCGMGMTFMFGRPTIQPGLYHLYVLADGSPVSATLVLDGLSGEVILSAPPYAGAVIQDLSPVLPQTGAPQPAVYSAGATAPIGDNGGILLGSSFVAAQAYLTGYFGGCAGPQAAPPIYVAGCDFPPDQGTVVTLENPLTNPCAEVLPPEQPCVGSWFFGGTLIDEVRPGEGSPTWSQGVYFDAAALMTSASGGGAWLSYLPTTADAGATPAPPPPPLQASVASSVSGPLTPPAAAAALPMTGGTTATPAAAGAALLVGSVAVTLRRRRRRLA